MIDEVRFLVNKNGISDTIAERDLRSNVPKGTDEANGAVIVSESN